MQRSLKIIIVSILCCMSVIALVPRNRTMVDKVLAIIYHSEGSIVILQSDLRPDLSDQVPTLREAILRELILLDAKKYKITVSESDVDRHLARIQESLKKSRDDLHEFFKERGYTFEQAKKELEKGLLIETTVGERVRSKAFVPESEIKKCYEENPMVTYVIKNAFVPFGLGSKAITRVQIDAQIESGEIDKGVEWSPSITLKESDIAPEKAYIKDLKPGAVAKIQETDDGIALLTIESKTKVPYEVQKRDIMARKSMERQKQALDEYTRNLMDHAHVRYMSKAAAPAA